MSDRLEDIAHAMVQPGQGILAADESNGTMQKRFDPLGIENTADNRRDYREMLFRSEQAMNENVGGVILFEETLHQKAADGTPFVDIIKAAGAVPGIKVDQGVQPLPGHDGETVTVGLDILAENLKAYYDVGARFAKWRAVIAVDKSLPSWGGIRANAHALARYAALCQAAGIVPIVEPEVQMDGDPGDHTIERCHEVTAATLKAVFNELDEQNVKLEGIVLKPNMVVPGSNAAKQASPEEVAEHTVAVLKRHVPSAVPGIAFLSGGQSDLEATANLNAMNAGHSAPWALTYSYGRALQAAAREAWGGKPENLPAASKAFTHRARMNGLAAKGEWNEGLEAG
ncbi:MAG: fructose-bisphosphate aldolase class I [Ahrensia sp.]|nr:fructose-bisphosphate aldolase class I [Ahrensia sp.]